MLLDEEQIRSFASEAIYKRGKFYYERGNVGDLYIQLLNSEIFKNNEDMLIETKVKSENNNIKYDVYLEWEGRAKKLTGYCDCKYSGIRYASTGPCKHVIAVLIKYINEYQDSIESPNRKTDVDFLVEELTNASKSQFIFKREINIDITFVLDKYEKKPGVELKIGVSKNYIVKNMKKFIEAIIKEEILQFGLSFSYDPSIYKFKKSDEELIEMFLLIYEREGEKVPYQNYYPHSNLIYGKRISFTDKLVYKFMKLIKNREISALIDGVKYEQVPIIEQNLPLQFNMAMNNEVIELSQINDLPRPIDESFRVFWYNNCIYLPPIDQISMYAPIYKRFKEKRENKIVWSKLKNHKIISTILPILRKTSEELVLEESIKENFREIPLKIKAYLDKDDFIISCDLKFCYDDIEINPLKEMEINLNEGVLIRDINKEGHGIQILESFGFKVKDDYYYMEDDKNILSFITEGVVNLQEIGEVYYSESFKDIKVYGKGNIKGGIRINEENLLEFSFEIEGVPREDLKNVFMALREKKKYFRLKTGDFVSLEDEGILNLSQTIDYLNIKEKDLLKDSLLLSKYNAIYLDNKIKDKKMEFIDRSQEFKALAKNIKDVNNLDYTIPDYLESRMRSYQIIGFRWLKTLSFYGFGGILADEMGLGKTIEAIAFLTSEKGNGTSIIVVPTSLIYNWKSEIENFSPTLKTIVISGSKERREELIPKIKDADVVITSYPLIRRDIEEYREFKFNFCILDEAQQIKNPSSINASSVKEIKANGYFALTGTPMENSLTELWSIFDFIMPGYLFSNSKFTKTYEIPIIKNGDSKALEELNRHIKPFILRRLKKDVIKELPQKIEKKLLVEMTEEQKLLYLTYLNSAKGEINNEIKGKGFNRAKIKILSILTRLRQICCDPSIFVEGYVGESGKMLALDELLDGTINEGHRLLIFSQFTSVLKNIKPRLEKNKISFMYLDGSTKSEDRINMVNEFNRGTTSVFLISLKAGGTGLNLTGADVVLHFDPWWNPAVEDQATDRAHRIGQKKTVEVIKLIAEGTIEEKIFNLQKKKKEIINNVIEENMDNGDMIKSMTEKELEELLT